MGKRSRPGPGIIGRKGILGIVGCMFLSFGLLGLSFFGTKQAGSVIHRADYHGMLWREASRLGAVVRLSAEVVGVDSGGSTCAVLDSGERVYGDVVIGADGQLLFLPLWV